MRMVELGESEGGLAQLAVLLVGVRQPLHEAVLVDMFDASAALARVEQGFGFGGLAAADSASIRVD